MDENQRLSSRVMLLPGWSMGPLEVLTAYFSTTEFIQPSFPTPPIGIGWCWNPFRFCLVFVIVASSTLLFAADAFFPIEEQGLWGVRFAAALLAMIGIRLCVAGVVWFSVKDGARRIGHAIELEAPQVLVAFSWGAALAMHLLADKVWQGPKILLCPTYKAMARVGCQSFKMFEFPPNVHVFHALSDMYCPQSQAEELERAGCMVHRCEDDHLLMSRSSLVAIGRCLRDFLDT